MGAQRVEIDAVRFERRIELHAFERGRGHAESFVAMPVFLTQIAGLVEKTEIGAFDVEADRCHPAFVRGKVREDGREQELDRAGLGREARDTGDVEVRRLRAEQEIGVEVDGRVAAGGRV